MNYDESIVGENHNGKFHYVDLCAIWISHWYNGYIVLGKAAMGNFSMGQKPQIFTCMVRLGG